MASRQGEHDDPDRRYGEGTGEHLGRPAELDDHDEPESEAHEPPTGRLTYEDLVEQQEHEGGNRRQNQEEVAFALADHVRGEAVQEPADESGRDPGRVSAQDEEHRRRRAGKSEREEDVEGGDRAEEHRDGCADGPGERHRGVVGEVDAPGIIDHSSSGAGSVRWVRACGTPGEEPHLLAAVAAAAALHRVGHPPYPRGEVCHDTEAQIDGKDDGDGESFSPSRSLGSFEGRRLRRLGNFQARAHQASSLAQAALGRQTIGGEAPFSS